MMRPPEPEGRMPETVLIVDDEDGVRRTFVEWLTGVPGVRVLAAADAEAALLHANCEPIDLAVLDWNLGSGSDGLRLLEDLVEFRPDIVAILVTGFANQATPLDALRMGVRDYLDKNQDLNRDTFLAAVERQLVRVRPAKRQRELNQRLADFRRAVEAALPLVRGAAALNDPVPLPAAIHALFRFLLRTTGAADGALLVRQLADGRDESAAYTADGTRLPTPAVPFSRSLAASVVNLPAPAVMTDFSVEALGGVELLPFEHHRTTILAVPLRVGAGTHVVLELFDKQPFTDDDRRLAAAAADIGAELLRQALAERHTSQLLADAVEAALSAGDAVSRAIDGPTAADGPPAAVLATLKAGLSADANAVTDADTGLRLVEAVRVLAVRHGPPAVDHCVTLVADLTRLLDALTGTD
jgi:ActR/RegA family two-component response regulator